MTNRPPTRTWHRDDASSTQPPRVAQVEDPAVREVLLNQRRAFISMANDIGRRCGLAPVAEEEESLTA